MNGSVCNTIEVYHHNNQTWEIKDSLLERREALLMVNSGLTLVISSHLSRSFEYFDLSTSKHILVNLNFRLESLEMKGELVFLKSSEISPTVGLYNITDSTLLDSSLSLSRYGTSLFSFGNFVGIIGGKNFRHVPQGRVGIWSNITRTWTHSETVTPLSKLIAISGSRVAAVVGIPFEISPSALSVYVFTSCSTDRQCALFDNGYFCDGAEFCHPGKFCVFSERPCDFQLPLVGSCQTNNQDFCDERIRSCIFPKGTSCGVQPCGLGICTANGECSPRTDTGCVCPPGTYPRDLPSVCIPCEVGFYCENNQRRRCEVGKVSEEGASKCVECPPGFGVITESNGAPLNCQSCPSGSLSVVLPDETRKCQDCKASEYCPVGSSVPLSLDVLRHMELRDVVQSENMHFLNDTPEVVMNMLFLFFLTAVAFFVVLGIFCALVRTLTPQLWGKLEKRLESVHFLFHTSFVKQIDVVSKSQIPVHKHKTAVGGILSISWIVVSLFIWGFLFYDFAVLRVMVSKNVADVREGGDKYIDFRIRVGLWGLQNATCQCGGEGSISTDFEHTNRQNSTKNQTWNLFLHGFSSPPTWNCSEEPQNSGDFSEMCLVLIEFNSTRFTQFQPSILFSVEGASAAGIKWNTSSGSFMKGSTSSFSKFVFPERRGNVFGGHRPTEVNLGAYWVVYQNNVKNIGGRGYQFHYLSSPVGSQAKSLKLSGDQRGLSVNFRINSYAEIVSVSEERAVSGEELFSGMAAGPILLYIFMRSGIVFSRWGLRRWKKREWKLKPPNHAVYEGRS